MRIFVFFMLFVLFSCKKESQESFGKSDALTTSSQTKTPVELGKEIFEGKGNCTACHQTNEKSIGPSVIEMAAIYKKQNGNIIAFLKEEAEPIVDPSQYEIMKANLAITKAMKPEELQALEAYIYSHL